MRSTKSIKRGGNRKMTRNACACRRKVFQKRMEQMKNLQRNTVFTGAQVKILAVPQPIPKKLKEPKQRTVEEIAERRRFREQKNLEKRFLKQKPSTSEVPKLLISMKNIKEKKVITAVAKVKEPKKEAKRVLQNKPTNVPPSKKSKITDEKNKAKQGVDKSISDEEIEKPSKNKISKNIEKTVAKKKASKTISNKDDTSGPIPNAKVLPKIEGSGSYREKNNDPKVRKQEKVSHLKKVVPLSKKEEVNLQNGNDMNFDSSKSPIKEIISDEGIRTEDRKIFQLNHGTNIGQDNGKIAQLNYDVNIIKESGKTPQLNYSAVIVDQVKAKHATHVNEVKGVSKGKTTDGDLEMLGEHGLKNDKTSDKSQSHHADDTAGANTVTSEQEKKSYKKFQPVLLAFQKDRPPPLVIERPKREYRLLPRDIEYCTYMMETYGEDYENMIKDKKNVFLDTAKSIQRKIRIFRESPYYADYLKIKKDQQ